MKHSPAFLKLVEETMPRIREINAEEVQTWLMQKQVFYLIDVREDHEWNIGRIPGAIHLGRGIIERDIESIVADPSMTLVVYCGGGYRSALAADSLQKMGYQNVLSLSGGWKSWVGKGFPRL